MKYQSNILCILLTSNSFWFFYLKMETMELILDGLPQQCLYFFGYGRIIIVSTLEEVKKKLLSGVSLIDDDFQKK